MATLCRTGKHPKTYVVVLGGTCFMGRHLVQLLLNHPGLTLPCESSGNQDVSDSHEHPFSVVLLNRGTKYWGGYAGEKWFDRNVHWIPIDRNEASTTDLAGIWSAIPGIRSALQILIIDFSCFNGLQAASMLESLNSDEALRRKIFRYVLISTDSVYRSRSRSASVSAVAEDYPMRSTQGSSYAAEKAAAEAAFCRSDKYRWIHRSLLVLRLPDVIGPYDDTGRFWATALWARHSPSTLFFPRSLWEANPLVSYVYSCDVANLIYDTLIAPTVSVAEAAKIPNGVFNIAAPAIHLLDLTQRIVAGANVHAQIKPVPTVLQAHGGCESSSDDESGNESHECCDFYPSVSCGPLDTSAAIRELGWSPTPHDVVFAETSAFFQSEVATHHVDRTQWKSMRRKLPLHVCRIMDEEACLTAVVEHVQGNQSV